MVDKFINTIVFFLFLYLEQAIDNLLVVFVLFGSFRASKTRDHLGL